MASKKCPSCKEPVSFKYMELISGMLNLRCKACEAELEPNEGYLYKKLGLSKRDSIFAHFVIAIIFVVFFNVVFDIELGIWGALFISFIIIGTISLFEFVFHSPLQVKDENLGALIQNPFGNPEEGRVITPAERLAYLDKEKDSAER
jgi:hypothetical protein